MKGGGEVTGRRGGAAAGERGSAAAPETDDVPGCQRAPIDGRPLSLSLLLTRSTSGWPGLTGRDLRRWREAVTETTASTAESGEDASKQIYRRLHSLYFL